MNKVFGIVGWSGSGKTDLTTRLISFFVKKKIFVSSIKHSHHQFEIDKEGKDSFKHIQSGSNEVIIYNKKKWALISQLQKQETNISRIIEKFDKKTEMILVEGLKYSNFPKLEVIRSCLKKPLLYKKDRYVKGIVVDKNRPDIESSNIPIFFFDETEKIANFILDYFKK